MEHINYEHFEEYTHSVMIAEYIIRAQDGTPHEYLYDLKKEVHDEILKQSDSVSIEWRKTLEDKLDEMREHNESIKHLLWRLSEPWYECREYRHVKRLRELVLARREVNASANNIYAYERAIEKFCECIAKLRDLQNEENDDDVLHG
jgi:hypothetical protein